MQATQAEKPSTKKTIVRMLVTGGLLVVIFGVILPQIIDFNVVWEVIKGLEASDIAKLVAGAIVLWFAQGWVMAAARPGLGVIKGTIAWLSSTCWANLIPIPFDIAVRFGMYRYWGFNTEQFGISTVFSGFWTLFIKLGLPIVAVAAQLSQGRDAPDWLTVIALIGIVALLAAIVVFAGVIRSESFARKVGDIVGRIVNTVLGWFKKPALEGVADRVLTVRENASDTVRSRWLLLSAADLTVIALNVAILVVALRAVGISSEVLSWADVLTGYAVVQLVTVIPITPGGVGVAALAYIFVFTRLANTEASGLSEEVLESTMAAAVFVYRIVTWLLVIPVGFAVQFIWRTLVKRKTGEDPIAVAMSPNPSSAQASAT